MSTWYSQKSGLWSNAVDLWNTTADGSGAWGIPLDSDTAIIQAGHSVVPDVDQSAFANGINLTITSSAGTPAALEASNATLAAGSYCLKIKTGLTIAGTNAANLGKIQIGSAETPLAFDRKLVFLLAGTTSSGGYIAGQYLDLDIYCTRPIVQSVRTYGTKKTVESVDTGANTLTITGHGWANATCVSIKSSGTLPAPLAADTLYWIISAAANTFQLAAVSGGVAIDLTTAGSGTIEVYNGHTNTATAVMNVLDDVTGDPCWTTAAGHNVVNLVDAGPVDRDIQVGLTLVGIAAGAITLSANVDSAQYPGARIWLVSRNVSIQFAHTGSAVNTPTNPVLDCEIRNTAVAAVGNGIYESTGGSCPGIVSGCSYGVNYGSGHTVSGTVSGCSTGVYSGSGHTVSGTVSGCGSGVDYGSGHTVSGTVSGCTNGVYFGSGHTVSGTVSGCSYGVNSGSGVIVQGANFSGNGQDIYLNGGCWIGYGAGLYSATQVASYKITALGNKEQCFLYDVADASKVPQPGQHKAWTLGGYMASEAWVLGTHGTPPVTLSVVHKFTYEVAAYWNYFEIPIYGSAGVPMTIQVFARKQQSGMTETPWAKLCDPNRDIEDAVGDLVTDTMDDDTDWQTLTLDHTPTDDKQLVLRIGGRNASGTMYWNCRVVPVVLPAAGDVDSTAAQYGYASSLITPTCVLPAEADVKDGVFYGAAGTEFEGEYAGGGYTYGDEDASKVLTTATGTGTYQPVVASAVQKGVAVGVSPAVGTLVGIVDSSGTQHDSGICDSSQAWASKGIIDASAEKHDTGVFDGTNYHATTGLAVGDVASGVYWEDGTGHLGPGTFTHTAAYTAIATVVSANNVLEGVYNYAVGDGGVPGKYHVTAAHEVKDGVTFGTEEAQTGTYSPGGTFVEGQAAQYVTDAAEVEEGAGGMIVGLTLLGVEGIYVEATAGEVQKDVSFGPAGGYTGTYDPMAAAVWPAQANVSTAEAAWGPTGAEYAGALDMDLYTLIAGVVAAAYVIEGHDNYTGGEAGLYHEALATEVQSGVTFGTEEAQTGTYSPGGTYAEGQASQYATDQAEVTAKADHLQDTETICGIAGTLDMDLWVLKTDVVAVTYILEGQYQWTGGGAGTLDQDWVLSTHGGTYVAPVAAGYSTLAPGFGAGGGTTGTLAASKIRDATYGTLADSSVLVAAGGTFDEAARNIDPGENYVLTAAYGGPASYKIANATKTPAATLTGASNVWFGSGAFGAAGNSITPTKRASSIANCSAGNVKDGVTIDDVMGTYDPVTGNYTDPGKAWVVVGHNYTYAGVSQVAEYPTTATSQAAQHATDAAFLETNKDEIIIADTDILAEFGVTGTATSGSYEEGYDAGTAAQLVVDTAEVTANVDGITTDTTILGVTGALDMDNYVLRAGGESTSNLGLLMSFARRWENSPEACEQVPFSRFVTGRIPTTREYPFPYISVIPGSSRLMYRSDKAEGLRRTLTVHIWVDPARLETGEEIAEIVRRTYANQNWTYDYGKVLDVLDGGHTAHEINDPTFQAWELVRILTLCIEQSRVDDGACPSSGSAASSVEVPVVVSSSSGPWG